MVAGPDCTATLKPVGTYGSAGPIYVQCTSPGYCSKTVEVTAGVDTLRVEGSKDGGYTWYKNSLTFVGKPGDTIDFSLRVTMTATDQTLDGWSCSVAQDAATIISNAGDLEVLSVTTLGTHTAGLFADFEESQARTDGGGVTVGFTQGVVIDYQAVEEQDTVLSFVTMGLCARLTLPQDGSYQASYVFTDDLGDGEPPIGSILVQKGKTTKPTFRDFTLLVSSHPSYTKTPSICASNWIIDGDGEAGPEPPGSGGGQGGGGQNVTQTRRLPQSFTSGTEPNNESTHARITPDGRFVVLASKATNLVSDVEFPVDC